MLNNPMVGSSGHDLFMQHLLHLLGQEELVEKKKPVIRGVSWLREPDAKSEPVQHVASPKVEMWTCPRCRSHRCMRVNPGNVDDPVYCCSVCGYTFHKASASSLAEREH